MKEEIVGYIFDTSEEREVQDDPRVVVTKNKNDDEKAEDFDDNIKLVVVTSRSKTKVSIEIGGVVASLLFLTLFTGIILKFLLIY